MLMKLKPTYSSAIMGRIIIIERMQHFKELDFFFLCLFLLTSYELDYEMLECLAIFLICSSFDALLLTKEKVSMLKRFRLSSIPTRLSATFTMVLSFSASNATISMISRNSLLSNEKSL